MKQPEGHRQTTKSKTGSLGQQLLVPRNHYERKQWKGIQGEFLNRTSRGKGTIKRPYKT